MSSIRPLLTIIVLAAVGVVLYLKINETEPQVPMEVDGDWSADTMLDIDMGGMDMGGSEMATGSAVGNAPVASAAPVYTPPVASEPAPAFDAGAATNSTVTAAPAYSAPPISNASPVDVVPTDVASTDVVVAPSFETKPSEMLSGETDPALPELPPAVVDSAVDSVDVVAEAKVAVSPVAEATSPVATLPAEVAEAVGMGDSVETSVASPVTAASPVATPSQSSLFSKTRLAVHAALDRGELSQALLLLSDWYDDPSLSPSEAKEVETLLAQLAGSVIYSTEDRLAPSYMVKAGERLETIAKEYQVPWQLLAKINGISSADQLQPGQKLKVIRGPFSALIDINKRKMTLMLGRRYAGQFALNIDPGVTVEEGHWEVSQKLLTPTSVGLPGMSPTTPTEERSLMLSNTSGEASQVAILHGAMTVSPQTAAVGRELRLKPTDAADVFDILSLGSKVVVRR